MRKSFLKISKQLEIEAFEFLRNREMKLRCFYLLDEHLLDVANKNQHRNHLHSF